MATLQSKLILTLQDQVTGRMRAMSAQIAAFRSRMRAATMPVMGMTTRLAALGGGYLGATAGARGTVGAAIKFEEAFADVVKVLDATPAQLQEVRHQILEMSKVLPNSAEGIASIYAAAAQSNIPLKELGKFSEMVAKVAVAWDVSEGETSDALAKIKNQLNLNVDQIGLYADAINQLGNNTDAKAPDLVDFSKRVAANGEMFGFSATQTLAFGGAMVASGAMTEVAATSFRNMGRALTIGTRVTKQQGIAFKRLGLDAVKTAKNMQKNALETTLDVLDRIGNLPEWERISIASALFGDEARAMMPVIANTTELRRQLSLVANEADYAGSAYNEYLVRASTTGNALAIIGNKIRAVGIEIGDGMLPSIKALGLGVGDVLDSLKSRVGIFDSINVAINGLMTGLGYNGPDGLRALVNDIGDVLFGTAFDDKDGTLIDDRVTQLARLSNQFRNIGRDLREFAKAVAENPVAKFLAEMAGHGFKLFVAAAGFTLLAGALTKLAKAAWMLSGAGVAVGIIKSLAGIGGALFGGVPGGKMPKGGIPGGVATGAGISALVQQIATRIPQIAVGALAAYGGYRFVSETSRDNAKDDARAATHRSAERDSYDSYRRHKSEVDDLLEDRKRIRNPITEPPAVGFWNAPAGQMVKGWFQGLKDWDASLAASTGMRANVPGREQQTPQEAPVPATRPEIKLPDSILDRFLEGMSRLNGAEQVVPSPGDAIRGLGDVLGKLAPPADPTPTLQQILGAVHQPSGTQNVNVTNPTPVHAPINVTVYATTMADAGQIAAQVGAKVQDTIAGYYGTSAYG